MAHRARRAAGVGRLGLLLAMATGLALAAPAAAQNVVLDRPVTAAGLTLFPMVKKEHVYFYVPNTPHLSTDENGRPQFSFLRYVQNVAGDEGEDAPREGEGGGIVHAVVSLDVPDDRLKEAQRELRRIDSEGIIQGPVIFKSGKFGLVSSFANEQGDLTTQVVGLGNAPVLEGSKAAVSIQLTKLGAKVLWQSFHTPTPDISFSFEMDLEGFMSPKQARIEANFDQIYDHKGFSAGVATPYLSGEIKGAFDDLRRDGAIKVESMGGDEKMEALIQTAYNKLTEMMFAPMGGTGSPTSALAGLSPQGQQTALDKASTQLNRGREQAAANCRAQASRPATTTTAAATPAGQQARPGTTSGSTSSGASGTTSGSTSSGASGTTSGSTSSGASGTTSGSTSSGTSGTTSGSTSSGSSGSTGTATSSTGAGTGSAGAGTTSSGSAGAGTSTGGTTTRTAAAAAAAAPAIGAAAGGVAQAAAGPIDNQLYRQCMERNQPSIAIVASFEMKKIRQRGKFEIDLNKWTHDTITLRFDENIGDLRRLMDQQEHFRQVNLDDPLFRQREIVAFVDGVNSKDFGDFINFVTVNLKKVHQGGEQTLEEVRIDRDNFNREGNNFRMIYGWKGDEDRSKWLEYQWQAHWSFFGGYEVVDDWSKSIAGAINLAPPYQRKTITLDADPDEIKDQKVRVITVKVYYKLGDEERVEQVTLNASRDELSETIEYLQPPGELGYEYEISWKLRGNKTVSSGRLPGTDAILFVDELPEEAAETAAETGIEAPSA